MNKMVVLRSRDIPEDVELITFRRSMRTKMEQECRKANSADEYRKRKQERQRAQRKIIRWSCGFLTVGMSALMGVYLAKGDLLSCCACIIICLLSISCIAIHGEY